MIITKTAVPLSLPETFLAALIVKRLAGTV